jgi:hypothetical protein
MKQEIWIMEWEEKGWQRSFRSANAPLAAMSRRENTATFTGYER